MFQQLLASIGKELDSRGLPYMVIGGQAVLLYGEPRLTRDIDITLGVDQSCLEDVRKVVTACGLQIIPDDPAAFVAQTMVLPAADRGSGIRVDFIFSFTPYEREAIARSRTVALGGGNVKFAAPEDLIIHKLFAGRPQDIADVQAILLKMAKDLDTGHIRRWLAEFDRSVSGKGFTAQFERLLVEAENK